MKIKRPDAPDKPVYSNFVRTLGLVYCVMGLYYIYAYSWWAFGLIYTACGLGAFLHLRSGRVLLLVNACIGLAVFWTDQFLLYRCCQDYFLSAFNIREIIVSTVLYLFTMFFMSRRKIKEIFGSR